MTAQFPGVPPRLAALMAVARDELSRRLVAEMDQQSLSREALALRSGVSVKTIKRIIDGEVDAPRPSTVRRLADGLDVPAQKLRFDPEADAEQLQRMEEKLDQVLDLLRDSQAARVRRAAGAAKEEAARRDPRSPRRRNAAP